MKLLTINTHSLTEKNYIEKSNYFAQVIEKVYPDIICMQEVNQSVDAKIINNPPPSYHHTGTQPLKEDNHALFIYSLLEKNGITYNFSYTAIKKGYDRYDEGLATFSKEKIITTKDVLLTKKDDYNNWKTRKALIIKTNSFTVCNLHTGWWDDLDEPFKYQWDNIKNMFFDKTFIMGDLNCPSDEKNKGYDYVINSGFYDTYNLAREKDEGYSVINKIDGWDKKRKIRIDYIFTNKKIPIKKSEVIFNNTNYKIISDHFGVMITI